METQSINKKKSNLIMQGSILAVSALIVRLIGFFYRIPLEGILTDVGNNYYSSAFIIYTFFLMISTYGFPAAISKIIAEKHAEKRYKEAYYIFKASISLALVLGTICALALWFGADYLAILTKSPQSNLAIKATAPALFIFSLLSVYRGYFQGMHTMVPTAISQIFEQIVNAALSLLLAYLLVAKGYPYAAAGSVIGTGAGALIAFIIIIILYSIASKGVLKKRIRKDRKIFIKKNIFAYWGVILKISIPIVIGTAILNLSSVIDMIMIKGGMLAHNFTNLQSDTNFGIYTTKNQLLVNLPVTIAAALSMASIPSISASLINNNMHEVREKIDAAVRTTLIIVIPAAVGEYILAGPIMEMLFKTGDLKFAAYLLKLSAVSIVFFGVYTVCVGILQGLGKLKVQIYISIIAVAIKVGLNYLLMYVFNFNIYGAIIANNIFAFIYAALSIWVIHRFISFKMDFKKSIMVPIVSAIFMGIFSYLTYFGVGLAGGNNTLSTIAAIIIGLLIYTIFMLKLKGLDEGDIMSFPKGAVLLKTFKILRLI